MPSPPRAMSVPSALNTITIVFPPSSVPDQLPTTEGAGVVAPFEHPAKATRVASRPISIILTLAPREPNRPLYASRDSASRTFDTHPRSDSSALPLAVTKMS